MNNKIRLFISLVLVTVFLSVNIYGDEGLNEPNSTEENSNEIVENGDSSVTTEDNQVENEENIDSNNESTTDENSEALNEKVISENDEDVLNEVIIEYKDQNTKDKIITLSEEILSDFQLLNAVGVKITDENLKELSLLEGINNIEVNSEINLFDEEVNKTSDTFKVNSTEISWNLKLLQTPLAWESGLTGSGIKIGVIDTGVASHSDLKITGGVSTIDEDPTWEDTNGHGTHVAGIIAGLYNNNGIVGVSPEADLYAIKALSQDGTGNLIDILEALEWSINQQMDVVNLSLGTAENSAYLEKLINKAYDNGILIISSAGNDGNSSSVLYPARYEKVIAVGSLNKSLALSNFSATGPEIEFTSLGENILSTSLNNNFEYMNGTSQAAANVTGIVALFKQQNPNMSNDELRKKLTENVEDLGTVGLDEKYGYGFLKYNTTENSSSTTTTVDTNDAIKITTNNASIYDIRSGEYNEIGKLDQGETYRHRGKSGKYYIIQFDDFNGYVHEGHTITGDGSQIVNPYPNNDVFPHLISTIENTIVYDNSSGSLVPFGQIASNTTYNVKEGSENWWEIQFADRIGYVKKASTKEIFSDNDDFFEVQSNDATVYDIRSGDYKEVGKLENGQVYKRLGMSGNYHKIQFSDYVGYIHKGHSTVSQNNLSNIYSDTKSFERIVKTKEKVNVYDNTSGSFVKFGELNANINYKIIDGGTNWWKVILANRVGYINKQSVKADFIASDNYFKVNSNSATIYDISSGNYRKVGKLENDQEYIRKGRSGNYHKIQFSDFIGYVHFGHTETSTGSSINNENRKISSGNSSVKISENVNVYDNTSGSFVKFAEISSNMQYRIINAGENWTKIKLGDRIGYINSKFILSEFNSSDKYFQITSTNATIYDIRSGSYKDIGKLNRGQTYIRVGQSGNYHQIRVGDYYGFVHTSHSIPIKNADIKNQTRNRRPIGDLTTIRETNVYDNTGNNGFTSFVELKKGVKLSIVNKSGNWYEVNISGRYGYISASNVNANIVIAKNLVNPRKVYSYDDMRVDISQLSNQYNDLVSWSTIGKSVDGRNLYSIKLGKGSTKIFLNGAHHAREWLTTNLLMEMVDSYSQAYANNTSVGGYNARDILNKVSIYVVPMVNPDGVTLVQKGAFSSKRPADVIRINGGSTNFDRWKANIRGVDLNRQYPADWADIQRNRTSPSYMNHKGQFALSEPESRAIYDFTRSHDFKTAVAYHSSGEILYWNYKLRNGTALKATSRRIANMISNKTGYPLFMPGSNPSGGGFTDWFIQGQKKPGFTPEISPHVGERPVPVSYFDSIWNENNSIGLMLAKEAYDNRYNR
ncbi:S8 family serine peptidase [Saliterribacillus persicus]|uniref:SH3 domain-containing protein n=1 Tax=Saliterribacillus persicus TaxID=930114 RepID=A0A368YGS7_9BACI|nr:S8 family serine peptidase [Saliterribacillus persicus]RCW77394.1 SH3 domain-containing protein [Saliterribacillus persicus]